MERLRRYLVTGLLVVVPIFLTVYVVLVIFKFADNILGRYFNVYIKGKLGFYIPGLGFLISVFFIIFIGFLASRFLGKRVFLILERWFSNLPLINKIYPALKQIVSFILAQKEFGFKKVVLVQYPSKGLWSMGFLTNEQFKKINETCGQELVSVFLPTTPGPLTGFIVFVPKGEVRFLDISVSDALKIIISGGVFKPND